MTLKGIDSIRVLMVEIPGELIAIKFMMIPAHLQAGSHSDNGIIHKAKMNLDVISQQDFALKIIEGLMFQDMTPIPIGSTLERITALYTLL